MRAASRTIDMLWRTALDEKSAESVRLGEASHALHRALVALTPTRRDSV